METKDNLSSCSDLDEQEIQQLQKQANERTFKSVLSRNMLNLERQLNKETLHEKDSNSNLSVIKVQFDQFIHQKSGYEPSNIHNLSLMILERQEHESLAISYYPHRTTIYVCPELEKVDSNVIPDLSDMCDNEIQTAQNAVECDDERSALANLIANLKLDIDEAKRFKNN
ncbi:hypothetical protein Tco_0414993 [Tanacetum coccineum]